MSLLLISQAYSQLHELCWDENEEISPRDVQSVVKCSIKSIKKVAGIKQSLRRKYELRKRRLTSVRSIINGDLKQKKVFGLKPKTISKRSCKPNSKNVQPKLDINSANQSKISPNAPDLYSRAWPFTHLKLVLNFKSDSEANSSPKKKVSLTTADNWKREGEIFVYHDTLTSADKERLERMKEGYYSCSESEEEDELEEESDDKESKPIAGLNLDESLFIPVIKRKKISKPVRTIKHKRDEDQAFSFPVTRNQKLAAGRNKVGENVKSDMSRNSYFDDILTRFENDRKKKPKIDKIVVLKLERCDNLVHQIRTTTALRETTNTRKLNKGNCKIEEKPFKCTECSKKYSTAMNLREHDKIVHFGRKPLKCPTCPKTFLWKGTLSNHIKIFHSKNGQEKTKCPICFKIFYSSFNLKQHNKIVHLKIKPFQCSICLKQFSHKNSLKGHICSRQKPFECPTCKKRFSVMNYLRIHQRIHNETKPFECSICSVGFTRKNNLREHIKRKHNQI